MQFDAKQMREEALPSKGRYHFTILFTKEKTSSNGNNMFNFKLRLQKDQQKAFIFYSNLVVTAKMFWLFEHFCKATGMPDKIDEGNLMAQECDGKEGYLDLDHRANSETGEIEPYIKDFIKPDESMVATKNKDNDFFDDVISL